MTGDNEPPAGEAGGGSTAMTRCGFVALIGAPNAGKSTLTNKLVGTKVFDCNPQGADDEKPHSRHRAV